MIDTVQLARRRFPGAQVNLDALCRRFNIDLSARVKHGALLDAELLAEVYLELIGGSRTGGSAWLRREPPTARRQPETSPARAANRGPMRRARRNWLPMRPFWKN